MTTKEKLFYSLFAFFVLTAAGCGDRGGSNAAVNYAADARLGRTLFVERGCVICHSVNGVGGKAAPPLDAGSEANAGSDPLAFAARIWRGAPAMVELQSIELGYVIELEAADIANLEAFAAAPTEQKKLTADDIPEPMRDGLLDVRFWEVED